MVALYNEIVEVPRSRARAPKKSKAKSRWPTLYQVEDNGERGHFDVAIIDPPWPHANFSKTRSGKSPKYDVMDLADLSALGPTIRGLLAKDAVALVWVTAPHLANALVVIANWGLEYRSYRVWNKKRQACGYWVRSDVELVLICTRGKPKAPIMGKQGRSLFEAPRATKDHSSKPATLHEWAETHYPNARKLELFARRPRESWTAIGSDLGMLITDKGVVRL